MLYIIMIIRNQLQQVVGLDGRAGAGCAVVDAVLCWGTKLNVKGKASNQSETRFII